MNPGAVAFGRPEGTFRQDPPQAAQLDRLPPVGAHNAVVGADQGFRAPSWDQESVRDSVHEDSGSARIVAGQRPRPRFRHPQPCRCAALVAEV